MPSSPKGLVSISLAHRDPNPLLSETLPSKHLSPAHGGSIHVLMMPAD